MLYTRMSIACFIFILFSGIIYFKNRKLPLKSTKIFIFLFATSLLYLVFDGITIYTVNHLEVVDGKLVDTTWNYVAHILFLILINAVVYLFYVYVTYHTDLRKKRNRIKSQLEMLPFLVSSILIIFLPIEYIQADINYSRGPKAYALYGSLACYIILILYKTIKSGKEINSNKTFSILVSIITFIVIAVIQMFFPTMLISSIGAGLFIISIVLSSENAEKYIDDETAFFNASVFQLILEDWVKYKDKFTILTISLDRFIYLNRLKNKDTEILKKISTNIYQNHKEYCYAIRGNNFSFLLTDPLKCDPIVKDVKDTLSEYNGSQKVKIDYYIRDVNNEEEYTGVGVIKEDVMNYLSQLEDENISIDKLTGARNRNAFEREFSNFKVNDMDHWIVLCDLNHFKSINDTYGHSKGDRALKQFTRIVLESITESSFFYRIGGDEFVLLFEGSEEELNHLFGLVQSKCLNVKNLPFEISFAYGYANMSKKDAYNIADKQMYVNKYK